jgi:hypothetical protein
VARFTDAPVRLESARAAKLAWLEAHDEGGRQALARLADEERCRAVCAQAVAARRLAELAAARERLLHGT